MPDHTPLSQKLESALAAYLTGVKSSMSLSTTQVLTAHQSAAAVDSPRIVVQCQSMSPRLISMPGVMDVAINVHYISDLETTAETHKTEAAKLISWLCDTETIRTALNIATPDTRTVTGLHIYLLQWAGVEMTADPDRAQHQTTCTLNLIAMGKDLV
jgi:hypothetical protein